jgi:2-methylcitrate dehydratase PrpD
MADFAHRVAAFVSGADFEDLHAVDRGAVERSVLDTVGTMLAGRTSDHGAIVEKLSTAATEGAYTVVGAGISRSAPAAAFANGVFAHADDFDDMGGYGHPSAPIVAALLAAVESEARRGRRVAGRELVIAHAIGFELGAALCTTGGYDQYERCFHSTPVFGALAATCAVARIMGLDETRTATALSLAASGAAGLGRSSGTMVKPLHAGHAARNAIVSAVAARNGATAATDVFEAKGGFAQAMYGHRSVPLDTIAQRLGAPFTVNDTIFIKRFPCCGSNQSALSAIEELIRQHDVKGPEIAEVIVHSMMETSPVLRFPEPTTACGAKFSIQYVLATMLVKHRVSVDDFRAETVGNSTVHDVAARIKPVVVNRWDMGGAAKHRGNAVSMRMTNGTLLKAVVPRTELIGGPRNPLPEQDLADKFLGNAERSIGVDRAMAAFASWRHVSSADDVAALLPLIR